MNSMINGVRAFLGRFVRNEEGVTAIEYALIAALIAAVIIAGATLIGGNINTVFTAIGNLIHM